MYRLQTHPIAAARSDDRMSSIYKLSPDNVRAEV